MIDVGEIKTEVAPASAWGSGRHVSIDESEMTSSVIPPKSRGVVSIDPATIQVSAAPAAGATAGPAPFDHFAD
jgi:hypothetical protein